MKELGERDRHHYLSDEQKEIARQRGMESTKDSLNRFATASSMDDLNETRW